MTNKGELDLNGGFADFSWLTALSPLGVTFVFVMLLCYFIRRVRNIPTSWTWPVTVIGVLLYMLVAKDIPGVPLKVETGLNFMFGSVVSILGTLSAFGLHDKAFASLASKWPVFGFLVSDEVKSNDPKPNP